MWQHHDVIHKMRMDELHAEAARERRWRLQDLENGRRVDAPIPNPGRVVVARGIAAVSRGAGHLARRLDARVAVEVGSERRLRDA